MNERMSFLRSNFVIVGFALCMAAVLGAAIAVDSIFGILFIVLVAATGLAVGLSTAWIAALSLMSVMAFAVLVPVQAATALVSVGPLSGTSLLGFMGLVMAGVTVFRGGLAPALRGGWITVAAGLFLLLYLVILLAFATEGVENYLALWAIWVSAFTLGLYVSRDVVPKVLGAWVLLAAGTGGYAIYEFYVQPPVLYENQLSEGYTNFVAMTGGVGGLPRSHATFGHPIPLGTYLATCLALLVWAVRTPFDRTFPVLKLAVAGVFAVGAVVTFSRSSWIALIIAVVLGLLSTRVSGGQRARAALAGLAGLVILMQTPFGDNIVEYFGSLGGTLSFEQRAASIQALPLLLSDGFVSTLFGRGPAALSELFGTGAIASTGAFQVIDNQYITLLIQVGLLGAAAFVATLALSLGYVWKAISQGLAAEDGKILWGIGVALATCASAIFFYDGLNWPSTSILLFALVGFIAYYRGLHNTEGIPDESTLSPGKSESSKDLTSV